MTHFILFAGAVIVLLFSIYSTRKSKIVTLVPFIMAIILINQWQYLDIQLILSITQCSGAEIPLGGSMRDLTVPERTELAFNSGSIGLRAASSAASMKGKHKVALAAGVGAAAFLGVWGCTFRFWELSNPGMLRRY